MQAIPILYSPRLAGVLRTVRLLRAKLRLPRRAAPPEASDLSAHLRRDVGLPPEARRPPKDPPLRIF